MRVLVACEASGIVRDAFAARGHNAWSCDLKPSENGGQHIQDDALKVARWKNWDLMIAHPPCTFVSVSGMHWTTRGLRDPQLTVDAIEFAEALWDAPIERVCFENPVSVLSTRSKLGKPTQIIQPYHFGEDASKKTCIWLRGLPKLKNTLFIEPRMVCDECRGVYAYALSFGGGCPHCGADAGSAKPRWANQTDSGQNKLGPSEKRATDRARTYPGIANAFASQWG